MADAVDRSLLAPLAPGLFTGQTALLTGGGHAIALALARLGARPLIAGRHAEHLRPTAREIEVG